MNICSIHQDSSPRGKKNISGLKIHADSYFLRQMRGGLAWFEYQRNFMEFYGKIPSHQVTRRSCRDGSFAWSPPPFFTFPPFEDDNMMPERCKVSDWQYRLYNIHINVSCNYVHVYIYMCKFLISVRFPSPPKKKPLNLCFVLFFGFLDVSSGVSG